MGIPWFWCPFWGGGSWNQYPEYTERPLYSVCRWITTWISFSARVLGNFLHNNPVIFRISLDFAGFQPKKIFFKFLYFFSMKPFLLPSPVVSLLEHFLYALLIKLSVKQCVQQWFGPSGPTTWVLVSATYFCYSRQAT